MTEFIGMSKQEEKVLKDTLSVSWQMGDNSIKGLFEKIIISEYMTHSRDVVYQVHTYTHSGGRSRYIQSREEAFTALLCLIIEEIQMAVKHELERLEKYKNPETVVINHHFYIVGQEYPLVPKRILGFGGRMFTLKFLDGRIVRTTNLWHGGPILENFWSLMPDNAIFIQDEK